MFLERYSQMKDIVIIANFPGNLSGIGNGRFLYLCNELSEKNQVEMITTDFDHVKKALRESKTFEWKFKITCLHEPGYKKNVSVRRFLSHYVWGKEVGRYLKKRKKPDAIYCAVPSLKAALVTSKYCKKNNIRFIIDIQDLWPEAFKMVFRVPVISDILFFPFNIVANKIYKSADEIIAVSDEYVKRALSVNTKCDLGHTIYLGTKVETFDEGAEGAPLYYKEDGEFWIGYCGSLSVSYDIPNLILAVNELYKKGYKEIKLIIMGDGGYRERYECIAKEFGVAAVFTGKLPYDQMCAQLKECDIVVNPIKGGSAASIINKHGDYAASGLPVVNSQDSLEYRSLVEQYNMGLNCNNEDADDMADKLELLINNKSMRIEMGMNARRCAEEKFDRKVTYSKIFKVIYNE